jgi:holo-[acyl-carrier protein] synthase
MPVVGIGVDVVEIRRVERMVNTWGERLLQRLFTDAEIQYCSARALPARHYAARIAAKEAAFKALAGSEEARAIGWRELELLNSIVGIPSLSFHGRARDRAAVLGVSNVHVSVTHGDDSAVAVVVLESRA